MLTYRDWMKKILLVEDDETIGSLLRNYLNLNGFDITWCNGGKQAFKTFIANEFDLCLIDVMLPETDGFTLARKIRDVKIDQKFIF
jgi:two-component system OmpR family response regulator